MAENRKLVLYIASSLDGYIATGNDDISFLDSVATEGEDYGYQAFLDTVDTVIMGRRTYDKVLSMGVEFPHGERVTYIITRQAKPANRNLHFYTGDLSTLVKELTARPGGTIFCDGGAEVANFLLKDGLIDELIISIIPVLLGSGIRLFKDGNPTQKLRLISSNVYSSGLVQVRYAKF